MRVCCVLMLLFGLVHILMGMNVIETRESSRTYIGVTGGIEAFFALMLLWEQTWAQFIMKWYLILGIFGAVLSIPMAIAISTVTPAKGAIILLTDLIQCVYESLMLYFLYASGDV